MCTNEHDTKARLIAAGLPTEFDPLWDWVVMEETRQSARLAGWSGLSSYVDLVRDQLGQTTARVTFHLYEDNYDRDEEDHLIPYEFNEREAEYLISHTAQSSREALAGLALKLHERKGEGRRRGLAA